jgi:MFS family permease
LAPLGVSLLALALLAPAVAARFGLRNAMTGGMALVTIASVLIDAAISRGGLTLLAIGFFAMGAGLALPYASAPRLALSALPSSRSGQGSGIINACTFLGGSCGVAGGAVAFAFDGFGAVLAMIALAGMIGAVRSAGFESRTRTSLASPIRSRRMSGRRAHSLEAGRRIRRSPADPHRVAKGPSSASRTAQSRHCRSLRREPAPRDGCAG